MLHGFDHSAFQARLAVERVGVAFDSTAAKSYEAALSLELLTNLLVRLYPRIAFVRCDNDPATRDLEAELVAVAQRINPRVDAITVDGDHGQPSDVTRLVVVGSSTPTLRPRGALVYIGSDGWEVRIGGIAPWGAGTTHHPFAAGVAACLGAAAVFRQIFGDQLNSAGQLQAAARDVYGEPVAKLSLLTMEVRGDGDEIHDPACEEIQGRTGDLTHAQTQQPPDVYEIGEAFLVGVGAIGNGVIWALARERGVSGTLCLVDPEEVELSNLQRYILTDDASEGMDKVALATAQFRQFESTSGPEGGAARETLAVIPIAQSWASFVSGRHSYEFDRVLLGLDSAEDRVAVQSSLPKWIANAWTQTDNLGISRHPNFISQPCVGCLYIPEGAEKSHAELVGDSLRAEMPDEQLEIRRLLHNQAPVGEEYVRRLSARFGIDPTDLLPFATDSLDVFYTKAVCGGLILRLGGTAGIPKAVVAPMVFQSALAGIMLAAELVLSAGGFRPLDFPGRTEIDLRRPLRGLLNSPTGKRQGGRCICQDDVFVAAYQAKYQSV